MIYTSKQSNNFEFAHEKIIHERLSTPAIKDKHSFEGKSRFRRQFGEESLAKHGEQWPTTMGRRAAAIVPRAVYPCVPLSPFCPSKRFPVRFRPSTVKRDLICIGKRAGKRARDPNDCSVPFLRMFDVCFYVVYVSNFLIFFYV